MDSRKLSEDILTWQAPVLSAEIPHGDMPGDSVQIGEGHIQKANTLFPALVKELLPVMQQNPYQRAVICVCGGSGVGKSEIASVLSEYLRQVGVGCYTLSGDNYPHRIPMYNDAERVRVFRCGGIAEMVRQGYVGETYFKPLMDMQNADVDPDPAQAADKPWLAAYQAGGRAALTDYLGTPNEQGFDHLSDIIAQFKAGAQTLALKRMGRDAAALWYDPIDFSGINVLVIEWTHGNSDFLKGVDVPIFLHSTPEETLAHRRARARDGAVDSAFTTMVLEIEQNKLLQQAHKAKLIIDRGGKLLSYAEYAEIMKGRI